MKGQASVSAKQESRDRDVTTADLASGTTLSMVVKNVCVVKGSASVLAVIPGQASANVFLE